MFSIISLRQQCQHRLKSPKNDDDLKNEDNPKSEDNMMKMNDINAYKDDVSNIEDNKHDHA